MANPVEDTINYDAQRMIGHGSFGAVFLGNKPFLLLHFVLTNAIFMSYS